MNCKELHDGGYIETTGKGRIMDVQIRVYPEGFGQIILRRSKLSVRAVELMCNNVSEAQGYLREIWDCLQRRSDEGDR